MSLESSLDDQPSEAGRDPEAFDEAQREVIAARAYELSLSQEAGNDLDNWLQAERELAYSTDDEE
jgi:hypothetical protein